MKQSEILIVRNPNSEGWEGMTPGTPFLKKAISREEVGPGFWLVHDLEDRRWYVIDEASGLMATRAPSSKKAKENFDFIRTMALKARSGKGYEEAKKRLLALQSWPIWDPKKESGEEFAKRLAKYSNVSAEKEWRQ